jgi:hypothetical protein
LRARQPIRPGAERLQHIVWRQGVPGSR